MTFCTTSDTGSDRPGNLSATGRSGPVDEPDGEVPARGVGGAVDRDEPVMKGHLSREDREVRLTRQVGLGPALHLQALEGRA